jgi:hypothetical protein
MSRFLNQPLKVLDRIYNFVGGETQRSSFDIGAQIQPVHDVSRQAERGEGREYITFTTFAHAGAGNLWSEGTFRDTLSTLGAGDLDESDIWLLWTAASSNTSGALSSAVIGVGFSAAVGRLGESNVAVARYDAEGPRLSATNDFLAYAVGEPPGLITLPLKVQPDDVLKMHTGANAVSNLVCFAAMWVGPRGATPPGMA